MVSSILSELRPVDRLEIIVIVDNQIDWSAGGSHTFVKRPSEWTDSDRARPNTVWAAHGLSLLVRTHIGDETHQILFDTGPSSDVLLHNLMVLGMGLEVPETIVLSHGHWDHIGGLIGILRALSPRQTPVVLHPRTTFRRAIHTQQDGRWQIREMNPSPPSIADIRTAGGVVMMSRGPVRLANGTLLTSGEIRHTTDYELGVKGHLININNEWQDDTLVLDDTCLIADVRDRGLVVITGCGHAGVVNTVSHAREITGVDTVYAILGGLHLVGEDAADRIEKTITDLKRLNLEVIVPCHCTGAAAHRSLWNVLSGAYCGCSVGNQYVFE